MAETQHELSDELPHFPYLYSGRTSVLSISALNMDLGSCSLPCHTEKILICITFHLEIIFLEVLKMYFLKLKVYYRWECRLMQPGAKLYGNIFSHLPLGFRTCQKSFIIEIRLELEGS